MSESETGDLWGRKGLSKCKLQRLKRKIARPNTKYMEIVLQNSLLNYTLTLLHEHFKPEFQSLFSPRILRVRSLLACEEINLRPKRCRNLVSRLFPTIGANRKISCFHHFFGIKHALSQLYTDR